jgi:polyisoprenoid-binding protein YceI
MTNETKWSIDQSHSEIAFTIKHLMISNIKGSFKIFDAKIFTIAKDFSTVQVDLWIDATSITTGDKQRDEHLKGLDFFNTENYKKITFISSIIGKSDVDGNHELLGLLTIKGITKEIKLNVQLGGILKDTWNNEKAGFTVTGKIKRSDWGLVWNTTIEAGGVMLSDEVTISCDIELINTGQKVLSVELAPTSESLIAL